MFEKKTKFTIKNNDLDKTISDEFIDKNKLKKKSFQYYSQPKTPFIFDKSSRSSNNFNASNNFTNSNNQSSNPNSSNKFSHKKHTDEKIITLNQYIKVQFLKLFGAVLFLFSIFILLSLFSYNREDSSFNTVITANISNIMGIYGSTFADFAFQILGLGAYTLPIFFASLGKFIIKFEKFRLYRYVTSVFMLLSSALIYDILQVFYIPSGFLYSICSKAILPHVTTDKRIYYFYIFSLFFVLVYSIFIVVGITPEHFKKFGNFLENTIIAIKKLLNSIKNFSNFLLNLFKNKQENIINLENMIEPSIEIPQNHQVIQNKPAQKSPSQKSTKPQQLSFEDGYMFPSTSLLKPANNVIEKIPEEELNNNGQILVKVLNDFSIECELTQISPGPVVTLYEIKPAAGIKSSRVIALSSDIARYMSAVSTRVAVVQGRNAIGIEIPNKNRQIVFLREMLESKQYSKSDYSLPIILGKNISGEPIIVDLAKMPHLLIAGTTGSGKSVGINAMILSLLYKLSPKQCRMIMIDPKMLELSVYNDIPHLLTPVVTDPKEAVVALKWAVKEMETRYKSMSKLGIRNIDGYNAKVAGLKQKEEILTKKVQTGFDSETGMPLYENQVVNYEFLPYIVIVVDEMADLMLVAGKDIEQAVQRLAQMARAAGIHLIMATQRPSVDVITGTIKANFPTRVSFQVSSKIDSRTVIGDQGAEQLLGNGDMLYMSSGGRCQRIHGPFCSDGEVEAVVSSLKENGEPKYILNILEDEESFNGDIGIGEGDGIGDDLYKEAVNIVLNDQKTSISYLQRRLRVGYNKAASLVEKMEENGVLSAPSVSGKREILI